MWKLQNYAGKFQFRPDADNVMIVFIILLAIFILGVQIGIKHGRDLERQDLEIEYGIIIPN